MSAPIRIDAADERPKVTDDGDDADVEIGTRALDGFDAVGRGCLVTDAVGD